MEKLSDCPFCGSNQLAIRPAPDGYWFVGCHMCNASGPRVTTERGVDGRDAAVKYWNLRVTRSAPSTDG